MTTKRFVIYRASPEDRQELEEAASLSRNTLSETLRAAVRRYLADLRRGRRK